MIGGQIDFSEEGREQSGLAETQTRILRMTAGNPPSTIREMSESIGISTTAIDKNIATLKRKGIIERVGSDTKGTWKIKFPNEK